ncbi:hypothetical protein ACIHIX_26645 [Streptomyces sp. NPDC051913]|uniref:hypothetical protein n=1 Tax=Streptomyces sp. NPDC051913 TaxID=3365676 RepID=UPI0037CE276D
MAWAASPRRACRPWSKAARWSASWSSSGWAGVAGAFGSRMPGLDEVRAGLRELLDGTLGA